MFRVAYNSELSTPMVPRGTDKRGSTVLQIVASWELCIPEIPLLHQPLQRYYSVDLVSSTHWFIRQTSIITRFLQPIPTFESTPLVICFLSCTSNQSGLNSLLAPGLIYKVSGPTPSPGHNWRTLGIIILRSHPDGLEMTLANILEKSDFFQIWYTVCKVMYV